MAYADDGCGTQQLDRHLHARVRELVDDHRIGVVDQDRERGQMAQSGRRPNEDVPPGHRL